MNASSFRLSPMLTERVIQVVSVVFAIYAVYYLYNLRELIWYIYDEPSEAGLYGIANVIFCGIIFPISVFFFWRKKKIGWILLVFQKVCGYAAIAIAFWVFEYIKEDSFIRTEMSLSIHPAFIVVSGICLLIVCVKPIREYYSVNGITMLITIVGAIVAAILWSIPLMQDFGVLERYQMRN
jgi:hypothetical protein